VSPEEIDARFHETYPTDTERDEVRATACRLLGDVAQKLNLLVPPGREQSLMTTHLEDAMNWAQKGINRNWSSEDGG